VKIEEEIGVLLIERRFMLAVAESCTGGLISHRVTSVSGSSRYFKGGVVAYANAVKTAVLGVAPGSLRREGAVSGAAAHGMAEGVRKRLSADIGLGVTGIAGPGGARPGKPVGLVFIALAGPGMAEVRRCRFRGNRAAIKRSAARAALGLLREQLNKQEA
jgi:PncC family amidohydrolase